MPCFFVFDSPIMLTQNNFKKFYAISLAWQLGFFIVLPIVGFLFLGFWVDKAFGTTPFFMLVGLLIGIVGSVYETYHLLIPLIRNKDDA